ncbi:type II toxin-antitoxin system Phd/YefM family antitoxin [Wenzhouxiangella limi]|uniref:Antitoxin n=1 Tax=Wenzhouxiangella limi TaxID=2707351 RepID=A0A845URE6_9GAMM|nr:type II toxin-antitoxin system prevent-host-death family antitoxin [Wenzhouxiangella limi]NDY94413.1 type II toxin-antitoxin system prevent-host-death family antitoxin [Wenzhouxiangella limi]
MKTVAVVDARKRFAQLLASVEAGEEVVITRRGRTVARLVPERPRTAAEVFAPLWDEAFSDLEAPDDLPATPVSAW